jgi:uncharacterized cupredoxin-like copper-binding protein
MKNLMYLIFLGLILSLILTACGGPAAPSRNLNVTMTDFTFSPNTFTVPAGEQISINATNNGAVAHSFIIMKSGYHVNTHFTDADKPNIFWEVEQITPGQSVTEKFTAPSDPGEYQIICGVAGHYEAGMVAKLIVVKQP